MHARSPHPPTRWWSKASAVRARAAVVVVDAVRLVRARWNAGRARRRIAPGCLTTRCSARVAIAADYCRLITGWIANAIDPHEAVDERGDARRGCYTAVLRRLRRSEPRPMPPPRRVCQASRPGSGRGQDRGQTIPLPGTGILPLFFMRPYMRRPSVLLSLVALSVLASAACSKTGCGGRCRRRKSVQTTQPATDPAAARPGRAPVRPQRRRARAFRRCWRRVYAEGSDDTKGEVLFLIVPRRAGRSG